MHRRRKADCAADAVSPEYDALNNIQTDNDDDIPTWPSPSGTVRDGVCRIEVGCAPVRDPGARVDSKKLILHESGADAERFAGLHTIMVLSRSLSVQPRVE